MSAGFVLLTLSTWTRHALGFTPVPLAPSVYAARMSTEWALVYFWPFFGKTDFICGRNTKALRVGGRVRGNVVNGLLRSAARAQLVVGSGPVSSPRFLS